MTPDHPAQNPLEAGPFGDLAANVEGDMELLGELVSVFLREFPEMMGNIHAAIERWNPSELDRKSTRLNSSHH